MVRIFRHYLSAKLMFIVGLEAIVIVLAIRLGLAFNVHGPVGDGNADMPLVTCVMFTLAMLLILNAIGLYRPDDWDNHRSVRLRLLTTAVLVAGPVFLVTNFPSDLFGDTRSFAIMVVAILAGVTFVRFVFYRLAGVAYKPRVLVLGTGSRVVEFSQMAGQSRNCTIVGFVALPTAEQPCVPSSQILGRSSSESLLGLVKKHSIDQIVIGMTDRRGSLPLNELVECKLAGVAITELATAFEREYRQVSLESITASWIVLEEGFDQGVWRSTIKRIFDLAASGLLLILTLPVIVIAALCIFIESGSPVLYRQERVGEGGRVFSMYKLRSMRQDAECDGTPRWAAVKDTRTTAVGRVIRKLHIDELPQIINVFKGDMSFVGPRPERPYFVDKLVKEIPYYSLRHTIKPGITGWAQVRYSYGASLEETSDKLRYDLYYVKNHALFLDLVILLATVEVVFTGKGAR
ncbi:MAG: TIGR03013 family XrtA/PEP-CTERM system glycosyltransferase [Casimicrobiaceae bacterium]